MTDAARRRNVWMQLVDTPTPPDASAVALERLQRLAAGELDADVRGWLRDGVRAYLKAAGDVTLDQALAITPRRGSRSWGRRLRAAERRLHLRAAWRAATDEAVSEHRRANLLAAAVADFERDFWPAWSTTGPPAGASALRSALFHARRATAEPLPSSWRRLLDICSE